MLSRAFVFCYFLLLVAFKAQKADVQVTEWLLFMGQIGTLRTCEYSHKC